MELGYQFKNKNLLKIALTHSSYANENKEKKLEDNERLEFLGDSVLGFVTADFLFHHYKSLPEGELTKLRAAVVCEQTLCEIARELGLDKELRLGKGEEHGGGRGRASILADGVEAVIAAVFLDGGIEEAKKLILSFLPAKARVALTGGAFKDYKTFLQEIIQKNKEEILSYHLTKEDGPDHNKVFTVSVHINSNSIGEGSGKSKKEAEQMAAKAALELMGEG